MDRRLHRGGLAALAAMVLAACGGSGDKTVPERMLRVTVTNLTAGQPMSPMLAAVHTGPAAWQAGVPASTALEQLAEGGDASALADVLKAAGGIAEARSAAALAPGASESLTLGMGGGADAGLTVATMLVNTNDAFAGVTALPVGRLAMGERLTRRAVAWDAGTEDNSEAAGTIPGPADGGEGFNAARNDALDVVRHHAGVVSADDGLGGSVLASKHRFDNPVLQVVVERIQ